jgi:hypothetical protein
MAPEMVALDPLLTCLFEVLGRLRIELVLEVRVGADAVDVALAVWTGWTAGRPDPAFWLMLDCWPSTILSTSERSSRMLPCPVGEGN